MALQKSISINSDTAFEGDVANAGYENTISGALAGGAVIVGRAVFSLKAAKNNYQSVLNSGTAGNSLLVGIAVRSQTTSLNTFGDQSTMTVPTGQVVAVLEKGCIWVKPTNASPVMNDIVFASITTGQLQTAVAGTSAPAGTVLTPFWVWEIDPSGLVMISNTRPQTNV